MPACPVYGLREICKLGKGTGVNSAIHSCEWLKLKSPAVSVAKQVLVASTLKAYSHTDLIVFP